jgi:hypothetical protein
MGGFVRGKAGLANSKRISRDHIEFVRHGDGGGGGGGAGWGVRRMGANPVGLVRQTALGDSVTRLHGAAAGLVRNHATFGAISL